MFANAILVIVSVRREGNILLNMKNYQHLKILFKEEGLRVSVLCMDRSVSTNANGLLKVFSFFLKY